MLRADTHSDIPSGPASSVTEIPSCDQKNFNGGLHGVIRNARRRFFNTRGNQVCIVNCSFNFDVFDYSCIMNFNRWQFLTYLINIDFFTLERFIVDTSFLFVIWISFYVSFIFVYSFGFIYILWSFCIGSCGVRGIYCTCTCSLRSWPEPSWLSSRKYSLSRESVWLPTYL